MTSWAFKVADHEKIPTDGNGRVIPSMNPIFSEIWLSRYGIKFVSVNYQNDELILRDSLMINDVNTPELINFACKLLYILRDKRPDLVKSGTFQKQKLAIATQKDGGVK